MHPLTGIIFIVLLFVGFGLSGDTPDPTDDSVQEIVDFYVDNDSKVMIGAILQTIAGAMFIFFGGYLYKRLRASGAEGSAIVAFGGTVAFAIGVALDGTISFALADAVEDIDPVAVQTLSTLYNYDFLPFAMGMLVFMWGFGVAIVRHGALPAWMGWVAIVAAITAISPAFFVAGIVAALLVLISSVMFSREERSGSTA